jgi:hypothetical protein
MKAWVDIEGPDVHSVASAMLEASKVSFMATEEGIQIGLADTGFFYNIPWDSFDFEFESHIQPQTSQEFISKIRRNRFGDLPNKDRIEDMMRDSLRRAQEDPDDGPLR